MKRTLIIAMAATGIAFAGPVAAHHNSGMTEEIEGSAPVGTFDRHNDAVEEVLLRLEDMGLAGNMGGSTNRASEIDPADAGEGSTCSGMFETDCQPGNADYPGAGMDRGPSVTELPESPM